jgi:hypothetical protein
LMMLMVDVISQVDVQDVNAKEQIFFTPSISTKGFRVQVQPSILNPTVSLQFLAKRKRESFR